MELNEINISGLSKGIYFIELQSEDAITTRKLINN